MISRKNLRKLTIPILTTTIPVNPHTVFRCQQSVRVDHESVFVDLRFLMAYPRRDEDYRHSCHPC